MCAERILPKKMELPFSQAQQTSPQGPVSGTGGCASLATQESGWETSGPPGLGPGRTGRDTRVCLDLLSPSAPHRGLRASDLGLLLILILTDSEPSCLSGLTFSLHSLFLALGVQGCSRGWSYGFHSASQGPQWNLAGPSRTPGSRDLEKAWHVSL